MNIVINDKADATSDSPVRRLLDAGSDLAGTASGTALALIVGAKGADPVAAVAAGSALGSMLHEIGGRLLGHREQIRVGGTAIYAARMYDERIKDGDQLRDDNWFDERPHGRSIAAEICEGTLLIAQREHEERKIEYYGYLLANLGFEDDVDEYLANWLLRLAEQLTWSQLVLLGMIGRKESFTLPEVMLTGRGVTDWTPFGLREQLADLGYGRRNIIGAPRQEQETSKDGSQIRIPAHINLYLPDMQLINVGALLFPLMQLNRIPDHDIELMIELLQPSDD
jgi:hypothetical protein